MSRYCKGPLGKNVPQLSSPPGWASALWTTFLGLYPGINNGPPPPTLLPAPPMT